MVLQVLVRQKCAYFMTLSVIEKILLNLVLFFSIIIIKKNYILVV